MFIFSVYKQLYLFQRKSQLGFRKIKAIHMLIKKYVFSCLKEYLNYEKFICSYNWPEYLKAGFRSRNLTY